ncbi:hypothetical protein HDU90_004472 [Geranomyces variabilis]|nr:hypothetical protein HDU90_004472 [Geranomyces variabilis]
MSWYWLHRDFWTDRPTEHSQSQPPHPSDQNSSPKPQAESASEEEEDESWAFGEGDGSPPSKADREYHRYRAGFYRMYAEICTRRRDKGTYTARQHGRPCPPATDEERNEFEKLLNLMTFKSKISYGYVQTALHLYLCYYYVCRIAHCRFRPWLFGDRVHCLAHPPPTYVEWVSAVQLAFYALALAGRLLYPPFERLVLLYGAYAMNGAVWSAWWFLSRKAICETAWTPHSLAGEATPSCGSWTALWTPVLHWWAFAFVRRIALGLAHWEHENQLIAREEVATAARAAADASAAATTTTTRRRSRRRLQDLPYSVYQLWAYFSSAIPLLLWDWLLKPRGLAAWQPTDLPDWPGWFSVTLFAVGASCALKLYFSFLHFQSKCVVWTEPFRRGLLIHEFEGEVKLGVIY